MKLLGAALALLPLLTRAEEKEHQSTSVLGRRTLKNKRKDGHGGDSSDSNTGKWKKKGRKSDYEVWASDQSNTASNQSGLGLKGGFLWIWDSDGVEDQLDGDGDAVPLSCAPDVAAGPCNMLDVFPQDLKEYNAGGEPTGVVLGDLDGFGRLHGVIKDPSSDRYVNANLFSPGGGFIGIIDTTTKEAIALFRATEYAFDGSDATRSVHMSFWAVDGSAVILANLNGRAIERLNVERNDPQDKDKITGITFDRSASLGLGKGMSVTKSATFFKGKNAFGNDLIGSVGGDYSSEGLSDLTPNGVCKENGCTVCDENGCTSGPDGAAGGRSTNLPICPITSTNDRVYITLAGGGLLVADLTTTPMAIKGEYGKAVIYGAGCGGIQVDDQVFLNAGVSASGAGATQSTFAVFALDDTKYGGSEQLGENQPMPVMVYQDEGNTLSGGNVEGIKAEDLTGQLPAVTTRRDSHGAGATLNGFVHVVDRLQNVMEVFDAETYERVNTYDLVSKDGKSGRTGPAGPCYTRSVLDDASLPLNDPAPDLFELTPSGKYFMIAFRGPSPVSVPHSGQGSCPGVGIVEVTEDGKSGKLVDVLRATNTGFQDPEGFTVSASGGIDYSGAERSDVHGVIVVFK